MSAPFFLTIIEYAFTVRYAIIAPIWLRLMSFTPQTPSVEMANSIYLHSTFDTTPPLLSRQPQNLLLSRAALFL